MIVEIIDRADVKAGGGLGGRGVGCAECDSGGLMEYLSANDQLFGHLPLQQPAEEPIVAIGRVVTVVDPVTAAAIGRPIAEAFLNPERKVGVHIAGAESAALVSGWKFEERKHADHRS